MNFSVMIPVSISQGFHFLGIRVRDAEGKWSLFDQKGFYITPVTSNTTNVTAARSVSIPALVI